MVLSLVKRRLGGLRRYGIHKLPLASILEQARLFGVPNNSPLVEANGLIGPVSPRAWISPLTGELLFRYTKSLTFLDNQG